MINLEHYSLNKVRMLHSPVSSKMSKARELTLEHYFPGHMGGIFIIKMRTLNIQDKITRTYYLNENSTDTMKNIYPQNMF